MNLKNSGSNVKGELDSDFTRVLYSSLGVLLHSHRIDRMGRTGEHPLFQLGSGFFKVVNPSTDHVVKPAI